MPRKNSSLVGSCDPDIAREQIQRLADEQDAEHRVFREHWLQAERAVLSQEGEQVGYKSAREDRFHAIAALVAVRKPLNCADNSSIGPGRVDTDFKNDCQQDALVNPSLGLEQRQSIFDHSSSPADVGASQGKARAGVLESASALPRPAAPLPPETATWRTTMRNLRAACRRLDDHWVGDLIGVLCLFGLGYAALLLGYVLEPVQ